MNDHLASRPTLAIRPAHPAAKPRALDLGGITLILHAVIMAVTAASLFSVDDADRWRVLTPLAIGGLLFGFALARVAVLDVLAHVLAMVVGLMVALLAATWNELGIEHVVDSRGRALFEAARRIVRALNLGQGSDLAEDDLLVLIALTLWLVGYSSAWMLYRRSWLGPALLLPGAMMLVSLRFEENASSAPVAIFLLAALVIAARHNILSRQNEWARWRVPAPEGVGSRTVASGALLAAGAVLIGWTLPFQAPERFVDAVADRSTSAFDRAREAWEAIGAPGARQGELGGLYANFPESFRIGGQFKPSRDPVASLDANVPRYLALRRYDHYSGHGWTSDVDVTFRADGEREDVRATSVTFGPQQNVALSADVTAERRREAGVVTVLREKSGLLFTTETFSQSSEPTVAVLGWTQLPMQRIDISVVDPFDVPVDLQGLVRTLKDARIEPSVDDGEPILIDPTIRNEVANERARLEHYPVRTSLSVDDAGSLVLTVTGRLPNYDDIEAVFAGDAEPPPGRYRVIGLTSIATSDELRQADVNYPDWVANRYLQQPTTISERTVDLAATILSEADADNPFDAAWAIQSHLQTKYEYALNSEAPPSDQDAVDHFLFDSRVGRCEHYASAMIVLARSVGIPSRMVSGYRDSGELTTNGDYLYREEQAHTWVEVFFPGYGWIPFEPTKGQEPFEYGEENAGIDLQPTLEAEEIKPSPTPTESTAPQAAATPPAIAADPSASDGTFTDRLRGSVGIVPFVVASIVGLAATGLSLAWLWGIRGLRPGAALYARALRIGRFWGVRSDPSMTPGEFATEFGRAVPQASRPARVVTDLYEAERFGGITVDGSAQASGRSAWRELRASVLRWRPWRGARRKG